MIRLKSFIVFCFIFISWVQIGASLTIPMTWDEMLFKADFVGIVECKTAGGIVAEYRVIEVWKGDASLKTIKIRKPPDYWGDQFPVSLISERYLVFVFKDAPEARMLSSSSYSSNPLTWRNLQYDFTFPYCRGYVTNPSESEYFFNSGAKNLNEFKELVHLFLSIAKDQQKELVELRLMLDSEMSYNYVKVGDHHEVEKSPRNQAYKLLLLNANRCESVEVFVKYLLAYAREFYSYKIVRILTNGGSNYTYRAILKFESLNDPADLVIISLIKDSLKIRLENVPASNPGAEIVTAETVDKLSQGKEALLKVLLGDSLFEGDLESFDAETTFLLVKKQDQAFAEMYLEKLKPIISQESHDFNFVLAVTLLSKSDPEVVVNYLKNLEKKRVDSRGLTNEAYYFSSLFAQKCVTDRKKHFLSLLNAKNLFVRVFAAIYLSFEDEEAGIKHLEKLMKMNNEAGYWAALALARRGNSKSFAYLLKMYKKKLTEVNGSDLQECLSARFLVLLSNSCKNSGVAMPKVNFDEDGYSVIYMKLKKWWKSNKKIIKLSDPWLEELKELRID